MSRRAPGGDADLRVALDRLRERALEVPGVWQSEPWREGLALAWRATLDPVDRHEMGLHAEDWPMPEEEWIQVLASLPVGYAPLQVDRHDHRRWFVVRLGRVRGECYQCGGEMDDVARMAYAETCSGCALERGELATGAAADALEITPQVIRDSYIARDPADRKKCAVYHAPAEGAHRLIAGGFDDRRAAERWMEYHRAGAKREETVPALARGA